MGCVERTVKRTILVAVAVALVMTGCGRAGTPGAGPESPVTGPSGPGSPGPTPSPDILEPRTGLVDIRPHPWHRAVSLGPRRLLVTFYGGVEDCYGLDRVEVREEPDAVTITVHTGRLPEAEVCIEIAVFQGVEVKLDRPLGDRALRDGAG